MVLSGKFGSFTACCNENSTLGVVFQHLTTPQFGAERGTNEDIHTEFQNSRTTANLRSQFCSAQAFRPKGRY
jgi:hypothetical protein